MENVSLSERRIVIPGAFNVRDLGGLPTTDGRTTRWGRFVRSDRLSDLPDEARGALLACGVRIVVDLRTTEETTEQPCSLAGDARFDYRHHNLEGDEPVPGYILGPDSGKMANAYAALLDARRSAVRDVFAALGDGDGSPAVFFCAGGTDRTGMIAALVLGLCGVPDEAIAEDYSLSAQGLVDRWRANGAPPWMSPEDLVSGRALATLAHARRCCICYGCCAGTMSASHRIFGVPGSRSGRSTRYETASSSSRLALLRQCDVAYDYVGIEETLPGVASHFVVVGTR